MLNIIKISILSFLTVAFSIVSHCQQASLQKLQLDFLTTYQGNILEFTDNDEELDILTEEGVQLIKFYIGNISLLKNGKTIWSEGKEYHLINSEQPSSFNVELNLDSTFIFDQIDFTIGTDSITNSNGPIEGDLDPINGMYWTWNNGYINFKIEGIHPNSSARGNEYQYHIGGFIHPHETIQYKSLMTSKYYNLIAVELDILFDHIDLITLPHIMSPSLAAKELSAILPNLFSLVNE